MYEYIYNCIPSTYVRIIISRSIDRQFSIDEKLREDFSMGWNHYSTVGRYIDNFR